MQGKPIFDNVLVELEGSEETTTEAGVIIPGKGPAYEEGNTHPTTALVLEVGPGLQKENDEGCYAMPVKKGQRILLSGQMGFEFMYNNKPCALIHVNHIVLVLEDE